MRGKWLLFSGVVILLAVAAGTLSVLRKPVEPPKKQEPAPAVLPAGTEISVNGKLQAAHVISVAAPMDGILDRWMVEAGQEVLEGQELGHIENVRLTTAQQEAEQELESAQNRVNNIEGSILAARLETARAESDAARTRTETARLEKIYSREQMLYREGATARLKFEKAEKDFREAQQEAETASDLARKSAERSAKLEKDLELAKKTLEERHAALEEAKGDLNAAVIVSPTDGLVVRTGIEAGEQVERNMPDLVLIAVDPALMEIVIEPEPQFLDRIAPGQPALVSVPEILAESLAGQVKEIKGTQVIIEFTSPNPAVQHGMVATARVKLS